MNEVPQDNNDREDVMIVLPDLVYLTAKRWAVTLRRREAALIWFAIRTFGGLAELDILPGVGTVVVPRDLWLRRLALGPIKYQRHLVIEGSRFQTGPAPDVDKKERQRQLAAMGLSVRSSRIACPEVLIGVIDSGCSADPDLNVGGFVTVSRRGKVHSEPPQDRNRDGHGTNVCRLLAGMHGGVVPGTQLVVASVIEDNQGTATQLMKGIDWLIRTRFRGGGPPGCDIINASLDDLDVSETDFKALVAQLKLAEESNKLIVCAVGNGGGPLGPMADRVDGVSVGAVTGADFLECHPDNKHKVSPSGKGNKPDICAPGSSSSYATPMVTGVAARLIQGDTSLKRNRKELRKRLLAKLKKTPVRHQPPKKLKKLKCRAIMV